MVMIELDPARERHLDELARSQGEDAALLAQRILSDDLDFFALPETEDDDAWEEASVKMAAAAFDAEDWNAEDQKPNLADAVQQLLADYQTDLVEFHQS